MRIIPIDEVKPGMILGKPILRENDGTVLFQSNLKLKSLYIEKIKALNYHSIHISDSEKPGEPDILTPIREETRIKAATMLKTTFNQFKSRDFVDVPGLKTLVNEIVREILNDPRTVYNLSQIRAYDNYTYTHSVDVCVLSLLIGSIMGLNRNNLEILGMGAILHDIGKIFMDISILNKPSRLDPEEYEIIKTHTRIGYESFRTKTALSFIVPHMMFQHHEREDGSGYPRGLTGKWIHRFAKIISVADVFDAMTSYRLYQNPVSSQAAIREICENTPQKYDKTTVDYFTKIVTPYSIGSVLLLSSNQKVEVTYISRFKCLVEVISGVNQGEVFNLYQYPQLRVIKCVS